MAKACCKSCPPSGRRSQLQSLDGLPTLGPAARSWTTSQGWLRRTAGPRLDRDHIRITMATRPSSRPNVILLQRPARAFRPLFPSQGVIREPFLQSALAMGRSSRDVLCFEAGDTAVAEAPACIPVYGRIIWLVIAKMAEERSDNKDRADRWRRQTADATAPIHSSGCQARDLWARASEEMVYVVCDSVLREASLECLSRRRPCPRRRRSHRLGRGAG